MRVFTHSREVLLVVSSLAFIACSGTPSGGGGGGSGGGGSGGGGSGGGSSSSSSSSSSGSGGGSSSSGGGSTGGGGSSYATGTGGANATGGKTGTGGTNATGGKASTGSNTGGTNATGGKASTGNSTGGANATGGKTSTGGANATGGSANTTGGSGGGSATGQVRWIGRADTSNASAVKFAWSGVGFVATVQGSKISVKLQSETSAAFFQPVIDGTVGQRFQVATGAAQTVVLGNNLTAATHQVELYRETEGMYGDTIFSGFVDGTVTGAPAAPGRLIEIIGDSISAGYGNLGVETHGARGTTCSFTLDTQSAYQAYSWQLARLLKADASIIARSGWGIIRDNTGNAAGVLSSVYDNTVGVEASPKWSFTQKPDAVIINLGTNDSATGDPGVAFETAYVAFLKTVRGHYPSAWIFVTIGSMTADAMLITMRTHLANIVTAATDSKVLKVDIDAQDATTTGCDYHPNVAEDTRIANILKTAVAAKLGW